MKDAFAPSIPIVQSNPIAAPQVGYGFEVRVPISREPAIL